MAAEAEERSCRVCGTQIAGPGRFCGRCGASLSDTGPTMVNEPSVERVASDKPPVEPPSGEVTVVTTGRRGLLAGAGGLVIGAMIGAWWGDRRTPRMTFDDDGLPHAEIAAGDARELAERAADGPVTIPAGGGRVAIVRWDPSYESDRDPAMDRYGPDGEDHPVLDATTGLLALSLVSTHLGCRVGYCASSQWFEDPCHGARWNAWGEWTGGPAPRGLDRYASHVRDDGVLVVVLTRHIVGPRRESGVFDQPRAGPACVDD